MMGMMRFFDAAAAANKSEFSAVEKMSSILFKVKAGDIEVNISSSITGTWYATIIAGGDIYVGRLFPAGFEPTFADVQDRVEARYTRPVLGPNVTVLGSRAGTKITLRRFAIGADLGV